MRLTPRGCVGGKLGADAFMGSRVKGMETAAM